MKVEIRIVPEREEPAVVIETPARTAQTEELAARLRALALETPPLWQGDRAVRCTAADILRFYAEDKGVFAQLADGRVCSVRLRLYELEERLDGHTFVRISHSEIVNLRRVTALDLSLSGTIKMTVADGAAVCYVSRRYVKKIKKALGL